MTMIEKIQNQNTKAFAVACYDENSIDELQDASVDATDCQTWDINPEQWKEATQAALADLIEDKNVS